jgi:hypothetical protein
MVSVCLLSVYSLHTPGWQGAAVAAAHLFLHLMCDRASAALAAAARCAQVLPSSSALLPSCSGPQAQ